MFSRFSRACISSPDLVRIEAAKQGRGGVARSAIGKLIVLLTLLSPQVFGQINTATVSGTAKDKSGAAIPGASVLVTQSATGISHGAETNDTGFFNVPLLQPGPYDVTVSKAGFQSETQHIELQVNQLANLTFSLSVGSVKQTVTVTSLTPELQTE